LDAYRVDLRARAGGGLDYVVFDRGRRSVGASGGGGRAHPERSTFGRNETVPSAATSIEVVVPGTVRISPAATHRGARTFHESICQITYTEGAFVHLDSVHAECWHCHRDAGQPGRQGGPQ